MKFRINRLFFSLFFISVSAQAALADISRIFRQTPSLNALEVCQGGGCTESNQISINTIEWENVVQIFKTKASNAAEERKQISKAIGELEKIVGAKNGTAADIAGTFYDNLTGQLDCNDEAINTTTYLRLLKTNGLMQLHEVEDTRTRNFFFTGWPHSTAVMHEINTGTKFAVDSWFYDNGRPATVVPFSDWKSGYRPTDTPIDKPRNTKQTNLQK